jgi:hypothetical protein
VCVCVKRARKGSNSFRRELGALAFTTCISLVQGGSVLMSQYYVSGSGRFSKNNRNKDTRMEEREKQPKIVFSWLFISCRSP